ncbi:60S acidic ribosomal protein P1 (eL12'/ eL12'-P) [Durusdinium trenchii]|uniref:60S acidic ribosomal protein P1 (EL12'/ eL12'-P) n=2 Tax=Durusdinium trenchii TaxID=1381693 RepID=A0ABP0JC19_9DINO
MCDEKIKKTTDKENADEVRWQLSSIKSCSHDSSAEGYYGGTCGSAEVAGAFGFAIGEAGEIQGEDGVVGRPTMARSVVTPSTVAYCAKQMLNAQVEPHVERCSAVCLIVGLGSSGVAELFGIESAIPMAEVPADEVPQAEKEELFCTYAAMILKDSELDISEDNINTLIKAAGGSTSSFFPALFAKLCAGKDLESMLKFGGGGGGGGGVAAGGGGGGGGGAAPAEKKEEKKVVEEEEEEEMEFDLFG